MKIRAGPRVACGEIVDPIYQLTAQEALDRAVEIIVMLNFSKELERLVPIK